MRAGSWSTQRSSRQQASGTQTCLGQISLPLRSSRKVHTSMATADTTKVVEADDAVSAPVRALQIGRDYGIGGFFFLLLIFSLASPTFLSGPNLLGILTAASVVSLFALAEALVVIAGAIDLS